jgi:hypothetical protein
MNDKNEIMSYKYQTLVLRNNPPREKSQYSVIYDEIYKIGGPDFWNYEDDLIDWVINGKQSNIDMYWFQPIYDEVFKACLLERLQKAIGGKDIIIRNKFIDQYNYDRINDNLSTDYLDLLDTASSSTLSNENFVDIMMKLSWDSRVKIGI